MHAYSVPLVYLSLLRWVVNGLTVLANMNTFGRVAVCGAISQVQPHGASQVPPRLWPHPPPPADRARVHG